ncbi:MAG TPA: nuclease [Prolixibacteraceae bacterium]|nr:nuclease [Prolixibacteraceae bacterium]
MSLTTCIKCRRSTKSVLETETGTVCFTCFSSSKDPLKAKRVISHNEADIQSEFFEKVKLFFPKLPDKLIFAIPNGGSRNPIEARNLKSQGVKSGVSDVILLIPKKGFASLCLEFKIDKGKQSDEQKEFQRQAEACGSKYVIVRSVGSAIETVKEYLK